MPAPPHLFPVPAAIEHGPPEPRGRRQARAIPDLVRDINGFVVEIIPAGPAGDDDLLALWGAAEEPSLEPATPAPADILGAPFVAMIDDFRAASPATLRTDPDTFLISSANPLPSNGREGDVLVMRDGRPQWVAPTEAFRAEYQYENGKMGELQVVARQTTPSHSIPRPPEPPPPPKKHRTAWEMLMDDEE